MHLFGRAETHIVTYKKRKETEKIILTYDEIKKNKEICECLRKGDENLGVLGYTDHSAAHCTMVAKRAAYILKKFGYSEEDIELVKIAGFMHDIGNVVNRRHHAEHEEQDYGCLCDRSSR